MTYQELTEGMSQWLNSTRRLADLNRLSLRYFTDTILNSKGYKHLIKSMVEITVGMLVREANKSMQREENDNSQRDRTDMLCLVIINLLGYLEEFNIISWTRMNRHLQSIGELKDRGDAFFLGLDAVAEQEAEQEAQLYEKDLRQKLIEEPPF